MPDERVDPDRRGTAHPSLISEVIGKGQQLVDTPRAGRDLRWHVQAAFLGDLPALASASLVAHDPHR